MNIAVLVSGGVDSAVALQLLKNEGLQLTAFYLKIWLEDELAFLGTCPWQEDLSYVQKTCQMLDIPLEIISLQEEYHQKIVAYTINEVKQGRTPNPDILCNTLIKFGAFYDIAGHKFEKIATGHYAKISSVNDEYILERSADEFKDQSYFLAQLRPEQLKQVLFPIGSYKKEEIRTLAHQFNLPSKDRKDSQGLCFLGTIKFREFIAHHVGTQEGPLVEFETEKKVGTHQGCWFYTSGQRQGIGLSHGPWYVVGKNPATNTVFISKNYHTEDKLRNAFVVAEGNWFVKDFMVHQAQAHKSGTLFVKMRHGEQLYSCSLKQTADGICVTLNERDQGIAPGQFAVFYDGTRCLGSAAIIKTL